MKGKSIYIVLVLVILLGCSKKNNEESNQEVRIEQKQTRDDIEALFYGKPESFVLKRLGEPSRRQELIAVDKTWWIYNDLAGYKEVKFGFDKWLEGKVEHIEFQQ